MDWIEIVGATAGIPSVIMGLTFLAAGTSVPDMLSAGANKDRIFQLRNSPQYQSLWLSKAKVTRLFHPLSGAMSSIFVLGLHSRGCCFGWFTKNPFMLVFQCTTNQFSYFQIILTPISLHLNNFTSLKLSINNLVKENLR